MPTSASPAPSSARGSTSASNRRIHGLWQSSIPSRFLDELPASAVDVVETGSVSGNWGYGASRFDNRETFTSPYDTPGWQRAQNRKPAGGRRSSSPRMIEGEVIARSSGGACAFEKGERVFHQKFGYGSVTAIEGNKLTVDFEKTGPKRVIDSFLEKH